MILFNKGSADAVHVAYRNENIVTDADFSERLEHVTFAASYVWPVITVGVSVTCQGFKREKLSGDAIKKIQNGEKLFFLSVAFDYKDEDGDAYPFESHYIYRPHLKDLEEAPRAYWPHSESDAA